MGRKGQRTGKSYNSIHRFVAELYGKPNVCEVCGSTSAKTYEWANITGVYEIARANWERMCGSCHAKFDFTEAHKLVLRPKGNPSLHRREGLLLAWKEGRKKLNKRGKDGKFEHKTDVSSA